MSSKTFPDPALVADNWVEEELGDRPETVDERTTYSKMLDTLERIELFYAADFHRRGTTESYLGRSRDGWRFARENFPWQNIADIRGFEHEEGYPVALEGEAGSLSIDADHRWNMVFTYEDEDRYLGVAEISVGGNTGIWAAALYPSQHPIFDEYF